MCILRLAVCSGWWTVLNLAGWYLTGSQTSVEEAEQELMELWSGVEKDKAAVEQRQRNVHNARHQRVSACTFCDQYWMYQLVRGCIHAFMHELLAPIRKSSHASMSADFPHSMYKHTTDD